MARAPDRLKLRYLGKLAIAEDLPFDGNPATLTRTAHPTPL